MSGRFGWSGDRAGLVSGRPRQETPPASTGAVQPKRRKGADEVIVRSTGGEIVILMSIQGLGARDVC